MAPAIPWSCNQYNPITTSILRGAKNAAVRTGNSDRRLRRYLAVAQLLKFKFVDNLRPPCSRCGRPLLLTRIEPEEPGFDLRTYYCAFCEDSETVIAPI
jgi:hypothetical protein